MIALLRWPRHSSADLPTRSGPRVPQTDRDVKAGKLPGYAVLYRDANGNYQTVLGKNGQANVWRPDVSRVQRIQGEWDASAAQEAEAASRNLQQGHKARAEFEAVTKSDDGGRDASMEHFLNGNPLEAPKPVQPSKPDTQSNRLQDQRSQLRQDAQDSGILTPTGGGM